MKPTSRRLSLGSLLLCILVAFCGCSREPGVTMTYKDLLGTLLQTARIADLEQPGSRLFCSYDRTGGNNDFSNFLGDGPPGWKIIVNAKGPGYASRFWFTGAKNGKKRIRFYLNGERKPRHETTQDDWCGPMSRSDMLPLRGYEPFCWYSWVPLSFSRSLVVMIEEPVPGVGAASGEKLFYQVNVNALPSGTVVEDWTPEMMKDPAVQALQAEINLRWRKAQLTETGGLDERVTVGVGREESLWEHSGPGVVSCLRVAPQWPDAAAVADREKTLRSLVVRMYWDGSGDPSVEVPLGPLFGGMWHEIQYGSACFGMSAGVYRLSFPMPFKSGAKISVLNQGGQPALLAFAVDCSDGAPAPGSGYFHSGWRKSLASETGSPHTIVDARGDGKYVGCLLGVRSLDGSWWALEGDEKIAVDGEAEPGWLGTGLEDYFNSGWYYGNPFTSPWHGLSFKAPFRTVQYRLHLVDPVRFGSSIRMSFERGPDNASHAEMESVSFYYLRAPGKADSMLGEPDFRRPVEDPLHVYTLMTEVNNMEILGDAPGAISRIQDYLARHPDFPFKDVMERRIANYANPPPVPEGNAVLGVYANTHVRVYLDGRQVADVNDPKGERVRFQSLPLGPGTHTLAVSYAFHPYPDWVQLMLEYPGGFVGTDYTWKYALNPDGKWASMSFDDSGWLVHNDVRIKGPPEAPYVWCEPHDRVWTQSRAWGIRAPIDWSNIRGLMVLRKTFTVP